MPDIDGELALDVRRAALARELSWLPAVENRGEGFFVAFKRAAIDEWLARPAVKARGQQLARWFRGLAHPEDVGRTSPRLAFPALPYVLLHSLAHLLITSVSLECGYSSSSIRERIYVGDGGLRDPALHRHPGRRGNARRPGARSVAASRSTFGPALDLARLCSNDPVCAQHGPDNPHEERFLNGAACHGCLLIAEPSCERRNEFLDRALVVADRRRRGRRVLPGVGRVRSGFHDLPDGSSAGPCRGTAARTPHRPRSRRHRTRQDRARCTCRSEAYTELDRGCSSAASRPRASPGGSTGSWPSASAAAGRSRRAGLDRPGGPGRGSRDTSVVVRGAVPLAPNGPSWSRPTPSSRVARSSSGLANRMARRSGPLGPPLPEHPSAARAAEVSEAHLVPGFRRMLGGRRTGRPESASPSSSTTRGPCRPTRTEGLSPRQVHRRRRLPRLRHLGQLHRGRPATEHRGRRRRR